MVSKRGLHLLLILLVTLAAFTLRSHALEYQSMWSDEGLSLYRAQQPLDTIFANIITVDGVDTKDTNPPFYFLLLHSWRNLAGETVFALRFMSAVLATVSVPLIYVLATAVFKRIVGLATAVFLAISRFIFGMPKSYATTDCCLHLIFYLFTVLFAFYKPRKQINAGCGWESGQEPD